MPLKTKKSNQKKPFFEKEMVLYLSELMKSCYNYVRTFMTYSISIRDSGAGNSLDLYLFWFIATLPPPTN